MKAAITIDKGNPTQIQLQEVIKPIVKTDWVLIRVRAFGLNRSEIFTRQGHSPGVKFPRIQGIECVGVVEEDPSGTYEKGQKVAAIMGGMGRDFDGSYAEYTLVPLAIVFPIESKLSWETLGAIPEMFQTVSGSLHEALELKQGETLLIRGGTSSIGMMASQLAKYIGATVIATTRNKAKEDKLLTNGADHVLLDTGSIRHDLKTLLPSGVDKVLELIGVTTLKDSLQCINRKGVVCMTGILGNAWTLDEFTPMGDIPSLGRLTVYMGEAGNLTKENLEEFIHAVESGSIKVNIDRTFTLEEVSNAHEYMESNKAQGKIVVLVGNSIE